MGEVHSGLLACMLADIKKVSCTSVIETSAYNDIYIRPDWRLLRFN